MMLFRVALSCLLVIGLMNLVSVLVDMSLRSQVYACSTDKAILPPDAALQCKRLTKGQWWHRGDDAPTGEK